MLACFGKTCFLCLYGIDKSLSTKFLLEIAIIALTEEVSFNVNHMSFPSLVVLALFGLGSFLIYVFFGEKFKHIDHD